jgi:hypothetical protein
LGRGRQVVGISKVVVVKRLLEKDENRGFEQREEVCAASNITKTLKVMMNL